MINYGVRALEMCPKHYHLDRLASWGDLLAGALGVWKMKAEEQEEDYDTRSRRRKQRRKWRRGKERRRKWRIKQKSRSSRRTRKTGA